MNNKKAKERWQKIQENKQKTCMNCSQLKKHKEGDYVCFFAKNKSEDEQGAAVIITPSRAKQVHKCYDTYNGLNLKL